MNTYTKYYKTPITQKATCPVNRLSRLIKQFEASFLRSGLQPVRSEAPAVKLILKFGFKIGKYVQGWHIK